MKNDGKNPTAIKNPLQILNDLQNGTVYELISRAGTAHKPIFTMKVTANGQFITGQGSSKKMARYEAANAALKSFKSEVPVKMSGKASGSPQKNIPPPVLNMNSKNSRVKLKNGNTVNVVPKNPLQMLNELKNGVVYDLISKTGSVHNPVFNVRITIFDRTYTGQGSSIRMARLKAAIAVLESLIVLRKEVTDSLVERDDSPKQQNDLIKAIQLSLGMMSNFDMAIAAEPVTKPKSSQHVIDPITLLYKIFPNSYFACVTRDNLNPLIFCMTVRVNGTPFEGRGQSKNSAKLAAAKTALAVLCHLSFNTPASDSCSSIHGSELPQALADRIGQLVAEKYNQLMQNDIENFVKRRVLAGFVMTRNLDYHKAEVITVATGNRCIIGEYMSRSGKALNDSHAEILSRRCLIDYFYTQLELHNNSPMSDLSIFRKSSHPGQLYTLKEGIQFHLYISISPCGDARVFGPHERDINTTSACDQRDNKGKGLLRSKIEAGEGTIPVSNRNGIQTWDGILAGEKLVTMSCSDKICRWNVLGLQGALLSNLIEPIYLHSLVLGSVFDANHVYRAICGRIDDSIENLPPAFRVNKPKLALISSVEKRNMAKTTNLSINWTIGNEVVETVESTVGTTLKEASSRICKYMFFQRYSALVQNVLDFNGDKLAATYGETKNLATNFQTAKRELFEAFRRQLLGSWLKKPIEQDQFGL